MKEITPELQEKLKKIKLLAMDVDGVLTDGGVYIAEDGREFRRFNINDGLGLKQVMDKGIIVAVISSSPNQAIIHRCRQLGISEVHIGIDDKISCLEEICRSRSLVLEECCYVGDDLIDLPILKEVMVSCAPADAASEVQMSVNYVCEHAGGQGCVREVCDLIQINHS